APIAGHAIAASWLWRGQYEDVDRALTQAMEDPPYPDDLAQIRVGAMLLAARAELARRSDGDPEVLAGIAAMLDRVEEVYRIGVPRGKEAGPEAKLWLARARAEARSEEHTSELQSRENLVCRLLLEKKNNSNCQYTT